MSYCRWSTDNFRCDLYVYHSVGDFWAIHVANMKRVYKVPLPAGVPWPKLEEGRDYDLVPIGLPHDGESFKEPTLEEAIARCEMLRAAGYRFPDYVLDELREELAEEARVTPAAPPEEPGHDRR